MKPIFTYIDYRIFLKDFYESEKSCKKYFSYRFFAQRAGLNAPILLKMVIDGKRNLSRASIEKFIKGVGLKEKEALFFRHLVLFNQAKSSVEKQEHYRTLRDMLGQVPQHIVEEDHFDYYDQWYYSVIREGVCQFPYGNDWSAIAAAVHPKITVVQAEKAVSWLIKNKFICQLPGGEYQQTSKAITTRSEVRSMVVRNFNRTMIQLAEKSLDTIPVDKRYATGMTIGLTAEAYAMICAELEAMRDRIVNIVDSIDKSESVYQLNFQLFPLMQKPEK